MSLGNLVIKGRQRRPITALIHGPVGIGKTTIGVEADNPIFLAGEDIDEIDTTKMPKIEKWESFIEYLEMLLKEDHGYKTLVIDTMDSIEHLLHKNIMARDESKDMISALGGYGRAYNVATEELINVRDNYLSKLRDKKDMNILILCHSSRNKVDDVVNQVQHDKFEIKLQRNARGSGAASIFTEWVGVLLFMDYEVYTTKSGNSEYAIGEGERVLHCEPRPSFEAKNRYNFPEKIPVKIGETWSTIMGYVDKFFSQDNAELKELLNMAEEIKNEKTRKTTIKNLNDIGTDKARLAKAKIFIQNALTEQGEK